MGKAFDAAKVKKRVNRSSVNGYSIYRMDQRTTFTCHDCGKEKTVMKVARNDEAGTMLCRPCFQKIMRVPKKERNKTGSAPQSVAKPQAEPVKKSAGKAKAKERRQAAAAQE